MVEKEMISYIHIDEHVKRALNDMGIGKDSDTVYLPEDAECTIVVANMLIRTIRENKKERETVHVSEVKKQELFVYRFKTIRGYSVLIEKDGHLAIPDFFDELDMYLSLF